MILLALFCISLILIWFAQFAFFDSKINAAHQNVINNQEYKGDVHVLVAFRNEASNILDCLIALNASVGLLRPLKVTLMDDQSTDNGYALVSRHKNEFQNLEINLIKSKGEGKKAALIQALESMSSDWYYFTDADCFVKPSTIIAMLTSAHAERKFVCFGPVLYRHHDLWSKLLAYDNLNTQVISQALLKADLPIMVNGGNLLIAKDRIDLYRKSLCSEYASGDDVFFAHRLSNDEYCVADSAQASVETKPPLGINALINQRVRWASKTTAYHRQIFKFIPVAIGLQNLLFITIWILWSSTGFALNLWIVCIISKWLIEWMFHSKWFLKYNFFPQFFESLLMSFFHPIYFIIIGLLSLLSKSYQWKGRTVSIN